MKRKQYLPVALAILISLSFFQTGCTSKKERLEKEEAYRTIGIHAMEDGDYDAATEAFNSALSQAKELGPNEVDICFYKAAAQFASGSYSTAIVIYDALLESDGKNSDAYFLRGCVYLKLNESAKALEDYEKALRYADNDEMYLAIYNSLAGAGYEQEAKTYLEEALQKDSGENAENDTVKGRLCFQEKRYEEAEKHFLTAIEKGDVEANLYLAGTYEALGEDKKAAGCLDAYIKVYPESSVACNRLGCKAFEEGDYEKAISYFKQGLELEEVTNERELRSNLIAAYEYNGDFETAGELMREYVLDYPDDAFAARENMFLNKNRNEGANQE